MCLRGRALLRYYAVATTRSLLRGRYYAVALLRGRALLQAKGRWLKQDTWLCEPLGLVDGLIVDLRCQSFTARRGPVVRCISLI